MSKNRSPFNCRHLTANGRGGHPPDAKFVAFADDRGDVQIMERRTNKMSRSRDTGVVCSLAFSSKGKLASVCDKGIVRVHDVLSRKVELDATVVGGNAVPLAYSPDGAILAVGDANHDIQLWSTKGKTWSRLKGPGGRVNALAFSLDGKTLISGCSGESSAIWDVSSGRLKQKIEAKDVTLLAMHPAGESFAVAYENKKIEIRDLENGNPRGQVPTVEAPRSMAFSADGKSLIVASGHGFEFRDTKKGDTHKVLILHPHSAAHGAVDSAGRPRRVYRRPPQLV